ncbi:MAG TPA: hypothetical protein VF331_20425 [Polyangiales bacterium]
MPSSKASAATPRDPTPAGSTIDFVRVGAAFCEVSARQPEGFRVRLGGLFRPVWLSALCSGLASHRVSIDEAHARLTPDGSWIAELCVVPEDPSLELDAAKYIDLANTSYSHSSPPRLINYELGLSADHGGTLKLTLEALDRLGLLGGLLTVLGGLALYPVEMHIATRDACAYDCLWLAQMGATRPSATARRALDRLLSDAIQG